MNDKREQERRMLLGRKEPYLHTSFSLALEDKNISYEMKPAILFRWAELMGYDHTQMAAWEHHEYIAQEFGLTIVNGKRKVRRISELNS